MKKKRYFAVPGLIRSKKSGAGTVPAEIRKFFGEDNIFSLIVFFLLLSAFFSCSEMVLLSLSKFEIRKLMKTAKYKKLAQWVENPSWFITGILIGNNVVNIGFGIGYTYFFIRYALRFGLTITSASAASFVSASILLLVFGEVLPKNIGKTRAKRLIHLIYRPLLSFLTIISPIINLVSMIERRFKGERHEEISKFTRSDLHQFIIRARKQGIIRGDLEQMIHAFLEMKDKKIGQIMTPKESIESIDIEKSPGIQERMIALGRSRAPVYKGSLDNIIGILYAKDILSVWPYDKDFDTNKFLRQPITVSPQDSLSSVFDIMKKKRVHMLIVKDGGKTIGLVTMEDILEEITGEILDEYDLK
ncbi:MAG: hemolysin family protein [Elusimicrobiota bacterium]